MILIIKNRKTANLTVMFNALNYYFVIKMFSFGTNASGKGAPATNLLHQLCIDPVHPTSASYISA